MPSSISNRVDVPRDHVQVNECREYLAYQHPNVEQPLVSVSGRRISRGLAELA
jgi:hypothetical protein